MAPVNLSSILSALFPTTRVGSHGQTDVYVQHAEPLPDHDLHNSWGCNYSGQTVLKNERIRQLWEEFGRDPTKVRRNYHNLLREYIYLFREFFEGYYPISLHAHVSDALSPTTVASLIRNTCASSPLVLNNPDLAPSPSPVEDGKKIQRFVAEYLGWDESHVEHPRFAVVQGLYGAGFGPLAHISKEWEMQIIASGPKPFIVSVGGGVTQEQLNTALAQAKRQGCIAVVVDIVSTDNGSVLPPEHFKLLRRCCEQNKLWFIVDEALTAIRCGAPFAFQRSEYDGEKPDLVAFGKGLGASGIAINFDGSMTEPLGFARKKDIDQTIMYWHALVSRPLETPVLLEALGILHTAQAENWPRRSLEIRKAFYEVIQESYPGEPVRGLGAILVLDRSVSMRFHTMAGIRRRSPWVRWLPKLDPANTKRELLETHVLGPQSKKNRAKLAAEAGQDGTMPPWCFVCGINSTSDDWCRTCFLGCCENEVCDGVFRAHTCI
ncbi:hypothetical protein AJ79_09290 [Helicocarpus griseus UAMH5409]|uniref:Uncharacterized protein n=1 Tax=Helicocarpus griseus UAMH5409 TaxID=1447875 RepID=A0A2B7WL22_9EURO|nr:hypothetical protein AJ79_09290 [Helicocarpus griseus UAMH5409]